MSDYQKDWHRYKELKKQFLIVWLGGLAAWLLVPEIVKNSTLLYVVAISWVALFFFTGFRFRLWHCPRCGNPYAGYLLQTGGLVLFRRRCVHCGLDRYSNGDTSQP
jgi:hypothetical protein